MNWKRAQKWLDGDHSLCVVCSKDFKYCKHSQLDIHHKIEELKFKDMFEKHIKYSRK